MKIYLRGSENEALKFTYERARNMNRTVVVVDKKKWHPVCSLDYKNLLFYVKKKFENPDCNRCMIYLFGHKNDTYVTIRDDDENNDITLEEVIKHYKVLVDKKDPVVSVMLQQYTPKEIIGSYVYIDLKERNII